MQDASKVADAAAKEIRGGKNIPTSVKLDVSAGGGLLCWFA